MAIKGLKLSLSEVSQTIDLKEITGVDLSKDPALRREIGQTVIDYIRERTADGKAIGGNRDLKKPYSERYTDTPEFKAADKSRNEINMSLTGSMISDLDILAERGSKIKIGFTDTTETLKAYNHNTGDTVPKRDFFGVTEKEMSEILKPYAKDIDKIKEEPTKQQTTTTVADILIDIVKRTDFNFKLGDNG
jgi:hypothetical protein